MDYEQKIPERYRIHYDRNGGVFRILDTWHESIKNLSESVINDFEVADDSPAIKLLNSLEINALIGELDKMGWLDKYASNNFSIENKPITRSKTIHEIAVGKISDIVKSTKKPDGADEAVSKEGIMAIREIVQKISI